MIKLIASDMDGTLLDGSHLITAETIKEVSQAQREGILFVITTGRMYEEAHQDVEKQGIKCEYLTMNGAKLVDSEGNVLQVLNINSQTVAMLVSYLEDKNLYTELYTSDGIYTASTNECIQDALLAKYELFFPEYSREELLKTWKKSDQYIKLKRIETIDQLLSQEIKVSKILSFSQNLDLIKEVREELGKKTGIAVSASFECNIEITDAEASKGKALKRYAENKGIDRNEIMAIGDSYNDLSMLCEDFGATVAMGNAIEDVKKAAKYVTLDNNHNGVAFAVNCARNDSLHLMEEEK